MKLYQNLLTLSLAVFACVSFADDNSLSCKVTVSKVDLDFAKQKEELRSVLWDTFVGRPEQKELGEVTTQNWRTNYTKFSSQLIANAKAQGFDADSLNRCLESILPKDDDKKSPALLPIGAYLARNGESDVWVIVCNWEYDYPSVTKPLIMGHIRVWALDAKTLKKIAFVTCS